MAINDELQEGFISQVEASMKGEVTYIPNPFEKMQPTFNLMQSRFYLIGAQSGVGKTSFVDDLFVMKAWEMVKDTPEIHWEVLYYSLERKKLFKHAKLMSWLLYHREGWKLSADTLLGWGSTGVVSKKVKEAIDKHSAELSEILDRVDIYDGRVSVKSISQMVIKKARQLGVLYRADSVGVKRDDGDKYLATFKASQVDETRHGKVPFIIINHNGKKYKIKPGKHIYITHNKHTFMYIVVDGLGLIDSTGYKSTKEAVDAVVNLLADARDVYGFSPIVISQFNRGMSDIHRVKHHGSNNGPQESDFKDSSNQYQAADVVIGMFDPVRSKAYDQRGMFQGYSVTKGTKSMYGAFRFRGIKVLKNSFGVDNVSYAMAFLGEVMDFRMLPHPEKEADDLAIEYAKINNGE